MASDVYDGSFGGLDGDDGGFPGVFPSTLLLFAVFLKKLARLLGLTRRIETKTEVTRPRPKFLERLKLSWLLPA